MIRRQEAEFNDLKRRGHFDNPKDKRTSVPIQREEDVFHDPKVKSTNVMTQGEEDE